MANKGWSKRFDPRCYAAGDNRNVGQVFNPD